VSRRTTINNSISLFPIKFLNSIPVPGPTDIKEAWFMEIELYYSVLPAVFIPSGCAADKGSAYGSHGAYYYTTGGSSYYAEGSYEPALSDFNKAIKINPKGHHIHWFRARIYKRQKKCDRALSDFNKATDLNPFPPYYRGRGSVYHMKNSMILLLKSILKP
jgi:tetratricopeptide (TPR) repeat protein